MHYKARSLVSNISKIIECIKHFSLIFDIIAISEAWTKENFVHFEIHGYSLLYIDRATKQGGVLQYM